MLIMFFGFTWLPGHAVSYGREAAQELLMQGITASTCKNSSKIRKMLMNCVFFEKMMAKQWFWERYETKKKGLFSRKDLFVGDYGFEPQTLCL